MEQRILPLVTVQIGPPSSSINLSLLWKVETNSALDDSKSKEPIPTSSNMLSLGDALSMNGHIAKSVLPLENVAISRVHSGKLESDENASDMPGPDIDMPLAYLWVDP
ncbi:hypothetical protein V6N13_034224 [Hibiscus sabdariffa]|uniref:Uncharacterized protein n=1 Tax=Hibiscus sabdariffa TaxID=183260 RepID=A0ABR2F8B0_9ROSI